MKVLVVGSGGREHAICWKIARSPRLERLWIAPGNAGTAQLGENLPVQAEDIKSLVAAARDRKVDLVIVGPEAPLAAGLVDALTEAGILTFGPTRAAASIEASKAFAKEFMTRHAIPTGRYGIFTDFDQASAYLDQVDFPVVVKASGLAAGKGVVLPGTRAETEAALRRMLVEGEFGAASQAVILEERLEGEEISLLAFSDGKTLRPMLPAQDHKRLLDGDRGPNTGGMGAYAPAPACPPSLVEVVVRRILQPAVDGLGREGCPFVGVLYAGLMLTSQGPRVLEFNCRFGDPETQVILPLLETDLLEIIEACVLGRLDQVEVRWKAGAAACVVLASENYPGKSPAGSPVTGLENSWPEAYVFHAGTRLDGSQVVTAGGRVLGVTGWGSALPQALEAAYAAIEGICFEGMQYRRDIGWRATSAYASSGVDISAGNRAVELMSQAVRSTYGPEVLWGIGAFGGLYDASLVQRMHSPVLVASTDGVGTKVQLAARVGQYRSIGLDLVNHCVNDILVQGARPLFFLDYYATSKLSPEVVAEIVAGVAEGCRESGCALLGGETAEMPGVYAVGEFDLAGTVVGVVERESILPRRISPGDLLLGLGSSGPHTNGYSLIRKIFAPDSLEEFLPELGLSLGEALLAPHRSYLRVLLELAQEPESGLKGLAHITGGGMVENIPRILPEGVGARLRLESWPLPPLFSLIQRRGQVSQAEMYRVFNMGIGMVAVVAPERIQDIQQALGEESWVIGELVEGERKVSLV